LDDVPEAAQVVGYVPVAEGPAPPAAQAAAGLPVEEARAAPGVDVFPASPAAVANLQAFTAPPPGAAQAAAAPTTTTQADGKCTGELRIEGHDGGSVQLISGNRWANLSTPDENTVIAKKSYARIYFAESCSPGPYDNNEYLSMFLLGKRMSWTVDLNGAGCGCNAGFYLASMRQNTAPSSCGDYYCDAHAVCGVACHEIDLQEANTHAWFSTLHASAPIAMGYGGDIGKPDYRDFGRDQYGPGSWCIDTNRPFRVVVSFHTMDSDVLKAMELYISQEGSDCEIAKTLTEHPSQHHPNADGHDAFAELTDALRAGMTPVISYWADDSMAWMDGPGKDGEGPCEKGADDEEACPDTVKLYDFKVEPIS
jgi:hypothetical protein